MYAHEFEMFWPDRNDPTHEVTVAVDWVGHAHGSVDRVTVLAADELHETDSPRALSVDDLDAFVRANPGLLPAAVEESNDRACSAAEQAYENRGER
jgi:hypothetical protein